MQLSYFAARDTIQLRRFRRELRFRIRWRRDNREAPEAQTRALRRTVLVAFRDMCRSDVITGRSFACLARVARRLPPPEEVRERGAPVEAVEDSDLDRGAIAERLVCESRFSQVTIGLNKYDKVARLFHGES